MNERIQELAYEAEDYADAMVDQGGEFHIHYTQKFAQLIIEDCLGIADQLSKLYREDVGFDRGYTMGTTRVIVEVKKHFGVDK